MSVKELIQKMIEETFENEKEHEIEVKDKEGNFFRVTGYDWCDQIILVEKVDE